MNTDEALKTCGQAQPILGDAATMLERLGKPDEAAGLRKLAGAVISVRDAAVNPAGKIDRLIGDLRKARESNEALAEALADAQARIDELEGNALAATQLAELVAKAQGISVDAVVRSLPSLDVDPDAPTLPGLPGDDR